MELRITEDVKKEEFERVRDMLVDIDDDPFLTTGFLEIKTKTGRISIMLCVEDNNGK